MMMEWRWAVCFILAIIGKYSNAKDISSSLQCKPPSSKKIECQFNLYNNGDDIIFVSKWLTPLEGIKSSCLQVTRNGENVPYDGIMIYRTFPPPSSSYVQISPKRKVSVIFDLSETYSINEPGEYTVSVYIRNLYVNTESLEKENAARLSLKSPGINFAVTKEVSFHRPTTGEKQRMSEKYHVAVPSGSRMGQGPLDPRFTGAAATEEKRILVTDIQRTVYHYVNASALEVMEDENHFKTWFGDDLANRITVKDNYNQILHHLENTVMTYDIFGPACSDPTIAMYTYHFSNTIYFCPLMFRFPYLAPDSQLISILVVMIHELTHSVNAANDYEYGRKDCKNLAKTNPDKALHNADNYRLFSATTYPFNFGIDAMTVFPNGFVYIFKGNFYARLGKGKTDPFKLETKAFPALIRGNWGNLTEDFYNGFDSIFKCGNPKYTYVTKGPNYVRYTRGTLDSGFPRPIKGNFGALRKQFENGFDSGSHLGNDYTYVTNGNLYAKYGDDQCQHVMSTFAIARYWGKKPASFNQGFDSIMHTKSGKTFVTKGKQYIRYSTKWPSKVNPGYPKDIRGNFGRPRE